MTHGRPTAARIVEIYRRSKRVWRIPAGRDTMTEHPTGVGFVGARFRAFLLGPFALTTKTTGQATLERNGRSRTH